MSLLRKIFGLSKHEQSQEQRIQYLESELEQTKNDLLEVQSIIGIMNSDIELLFRNARSTSNAVRSVRRSVKKVKNTPQSNSGKAS